MNQLKNRLTLHRKTKGKFNLLCSRMFAIPIPHI